MLYPVVLLIGKLIFRDSIKKSEIILKFVLNVLRKIFKAIHLKPLMKKRLSCKQTKVDFNKH